jgi:hypothetical protein
MMMPRKSPENRVAPSPGGAVEEATYCELKEKAKNN